MAKYIKFETACEEIRKSELLTDNNKAWAIEAIAQAPAIEKVETNYKKDLSHIMMFECEEHLGPYRTPKVVLYNKNKISCEDALHVVRAGSYDENVLCLDKSQFIALFRDGKE